MDFKDVARTLGSVVESLPTDTRNKVADAVDNAFNKIAEFVDAMDEEASVNHITVKIPEGMTEQEVASRIESVLAAKQPGREADGTESAGSQSLEYILGILYDYLVDTHPQWVNASSDPHDYRPDNIDYPEHMLNTLMELADKRRRKNNGAE